MSPHHSPKFLKRFRPISARQKVLKPECLHTYFRSGLVSNLFPSPSLIIRPINTHEIMQLPQAKLASEIGIQTLSPRRFCDGERSDGTDFRKDPKASPSHHLPKSEPAANALDHPFAGLL
jgi:hypothetical protein